MFLSKQATKGRDVLLDPVQGQLLISDAQIAAAAPGIDGGQFLQSLIRGSTGLRSGGV